jgi:3-oxoadipate enol-lactonase
MDPARTQQARFTDTHWIEVAPDVHLRYQRTGNGPSAVILLHELGAALESWDEDLPYFATPGRTVVRFDSRGAGMSTKIRAPLTMQQEVSDLLALLDGLNLKQPVVLVGDTFGAAVALQFAADHPERTAGVVAMDPPIYLAPQPQRVAKFPDPLAPGAAAASLAAGALDPNDPDAAHKGREHEFDAVYPPVLRTDAHRYSRFLGVAYSTDPTSAALMLRMIYSIGFKDALQNIRCPVVLTAGSLFLRPMAEFRELTAAIPNGRFVEMSTGHYAAEESPEQVGPLVQQFLAGLNR